MTEEQRMTKFLDDQIQQLTMRMVGEGFPADMILDRLWTNVAAQTVNLHGTFETVNLLQRISDQVAAGKFAKLEPRGVRN